MSVFVGFAGPGGLIRLIGFVVTVFMIAGGAGCAGEAANGRPWVHDIRFHGNRQVPGSDLRERLQLERTSWLPLRPRKYFDMLVLEVDRRRIEAFYRTQGLFAARVTNTRITRRGGSVDVDIDIDEGQPTTISRVAIRGLEGLPDGKRDAMTRNLPLRPGQIFDHGRYLEAKNLLTARLRAAGHAWAHESGEVRVDRDARLADVELKSEPGPVARFGEVIVHGASENDGGAVARRCPARPGQLFDPEVIETTRGRIVSAGGYAEVRVNAVPHPGDPTVADIVVDLVPGKKNEVKVGIGIGLDSDRQSLRLPFAYTRYHFLGGLRTLSLQLTPGYVALPAIWKRQTQGPSAVGDLVFTQPDFLLRNLRLRARAGYLVGVDYAFKYHGPRGAIGVDQGFFRDRLVLALSYNFEYLFFGGLSNPDVFNNPDTARFFLGYTNPYRLAYGLASATLDLRDSPLDPRRGLFVSLTAEEGAGAIGSGFSYQRFSPDGRAYVPVGSRVVLAGRVVWGRLFQRGADASPITRRFYAGGSDSHRGFGYNRLSPQIESTTGNFAIPVGGDQLFLAQVEARGDLFRVRGNWVGLAAFFDAGDVPQRDRALDFKQLHLAVGPGLRYRTIVGALRVDLGIRLNRLSPFQPDGRQNPDAGQRFAFHVSIGEAF